MRIIIKVSNPSVIVKEPRAGNHLISFLNHEFNHSIRGFSVSYPAWANMRPLVIRFSATSMNGTGNLVIWYPSRTRLTSIPPLRTAHLYLIASHAAPVIISHPATMKLITFTSASSVPQWQIRGLD